MDERRLIFHCPGMAEGEKIPLEHTGRGADRSPEFLLENLSPQAKTLAVTLEDLSHPIRNFTHWVIWNIPAADRIPPDIPPGASVPSLGDARQGLGYGLHRYAGPKPPRGKRHFYRFSVYALDCAATLGPLSTKRAFLRKAKDHILQKGSVTCCFE